MLLVDKYYLITINSLNYDIRNINLSQRESIVFLSF